MDFDRNCDLEMLHFLIYRFILIHPKIFATMKASPCSLKSREIHPIMCSKYFELSMKISNPIEIRTIIISS